MNYRMLGRTGLSVSEIGLGCEGFAGKSMELTKKMFDLAIDSEVNCMDLYSPDPELRSRIGTVLNGRRERFILQAHLCTVWRDGQYKQHCVILRKRMESFGGASETPRD